MLAAWIGWSIAFIGGEAILLAIAIGVILDRGRQLDAIRDLTAQEATTDDVAARVRRLQERLTASEFELDQQVRNASYLADLMGVGILRLDDALRIELANTAAHLLLGRPPGSIRRPDRRWRRSSTPASRRSSRRPATPAPARASSGSAGRDGPTLVVRARRSPVSGVLVVLEDVSELRRLQQIRTEFVDNLSHELRTPLSTISLLAETLARDADSAGDGGASEDARPDHEDRGRDRPSRPDGQRAARPCPDRERRAARAARRHRPRPGRRGVRGASPALRRAAGPAARRRRPGRSAAGPRRRGPARPGRRQPRPQRGEVQRRRRR